MKAITHIIYAAFALLPFACLTLPQQARATCQNACLTPASEKRHQLHAGTGPQCNCGVIGADRHNHHPALRVRNTSYNTDRT